MVTPPNTERSLQLDHRLKSVKAGVEGGPDLGWWGLKQNHGGLLQQLLAMKWGDNRYLQVFVDFYKSNIYTHIFTTDDDLVDEHGNSPSNHGDSRCFDLLP